MKLWCGDQAVHNWRQTKANVGVSDQASDDLGYILPDNDLARRTNKQEWSPHEKAAAESVKEVVSPTL